MAMPSRSPRVLVDRILKGRLDDILRESRENGKTFDDITFELRQRHGIVVSRETVRRWTANAVNGNSNSDDETAA